MAKVKISKLFNDADMPDEGRVCIYSLFNCGVCIYVGQSINVRTRIYTHLSDKKVFDSFEFEYCDADVANDAEADMIVKLKPSLNKVLPPTKKHISLTAMSAQITQLLFDNKEQLTFSFSGA